MFTRLKKKSEAKRKRLQNKAERRLRLLQKKREDQDEKEEKEQEIRLKAELEEDLAKMDEDAKEFFPDNTEWESYVQQMNDNLKTSHPSIAALKTEYSSMLNISEESESEEEETINESNARTLLRHHINNPKSYDEDKSHTTKDGNSSDDTEVAGTSPSKNKKKVQNTLTNMNIVKTQNIVFCKAKILVKKNENPTSTMVKSLASFLNTMLKVDKKLILYKYKDKNNKSFIVRPDQIPDTPSRVKEFFHGNYRPRSDAHQIWPELKLGINMDVENFISDSKCLLEDKHLGMLYKKDLQAEETEDIGFFLFSNRFQDAKRLTTSIKKEINANFKYTPELNLRWRKIYDPIKSKKNNNENKKDIKAIYLEVIKGQDERIAKSILKLYSKRNPNPIDGEKMRFIPRPKYTQNSGLHQRYSDLINRQDWYTQGIERATTFEISNLDQKATDLPTNLRTMIMEMVGKENNPLFTSIDKSWDDGIVITYLKIYEEEARNRIADLGSFLHFQHGDLILFKYFTPEASERALSSPWDPKQQRAISTLDNELEDILDECDQIDWLKQPDLAKVVEFKDTEENDKKNQPLFNFLPNDDKSLGTFGTNNTSNTSTQSGQKRPNKIPQRTDTLTKRRKSSTQVSDKEELTEDEDDATTETLTSRMSVLESNMTQLVGLLKQSINSNMSGRHESDKVNPITPNSKERGEGPL